MLIHDSTWTFVLTGMLDLSLRYEARHLYTDQSNWIWILHSNISG